MIYKILSQIPNHVHIVFELPATTWADKIYLVGDFNGFSPQATPFRQLRNGLWRAEVDLLVHSEHEFFYWVDGNHYTDIHADGWSGNVPGLQNSVVKATMH